MRPGRRRVPPLEVAGMRCRERRIGQPALVSTDSARRRSARSCAGRDVITSRRIAAPSATAWAWAPRGPGRPRPGRPARAGRAGAAGAEDDAEVADVERRADRDVRGANVRQVDVHVPERGRPDLGADQRPLAIEPLAPEAVDPHLAALDEPVTLDGTTSIGARTCPWTSPRSPRESGSSLEGGLAAAPDAPVRRRSPTWTHRSEALRSIAPLRQSTGSAATAGALDVLPPPTPLSTPPPSAKTSNAARTTRAPQRPTGPDRPRSAAIATSARTAIGTAPRSRCRRAAASRASAEETVRHAGHVARWLSSSVASPASSGRSMAVAARRRAATWSIIGAPRSTRGVRAGEAARDRSAIASRARSGPASPRSPAR